MMECVWNEKKGLMAIVSQLKGKRGGGEDYDEA